MLWVLPEKKCNSWGKVSAHTGNGVFWSISCNLFNLSHTKSSAHFICCNPGLKNICTFLNFPLRDVSTWQGFFRLPREAGLHYGAILGSSLSVLSLRLRIRLEAIWPGGCWRLPRADFPWQRELQSMSRITTVRQRYYCWMWHHFLPNH